MSQPSVALFDYGSGNLRSAFRALERAGADVELTSDLDAARRADGLVVPGVGAYAACMEGVLKHGLDTVVRERAAAEAPVLGICVGEQVLFEEGIEHGVRTRGVGVFEGRVDLLEAQRIPHMGWNTVEAAEGMRLFAGIDPAERFYFVHSYAAKAVPPGRPGRDLHPRRAVHRRRGARLRGRHPVPPREVRRRRVRAAVQLDQGPCCLKGMT